MREAATSRFEAPIAIVGAGPVGLNLALFLDKLGVRSVLFNIEEDSRWHPKGSTHNSRTMEHYRWLGISEAVRSVGLPWDFPKDIAYFTKCNAWELARFNMSSERESMRALLSSSATHQVPEPLFRSNQMYVEKYLFAHVKRRPNVHTRFGWEVTGIAEDESGANVTAFCTDSGKQEQWRVRFVVGCDGPNSFIRRLLGTYYSGHSTVENVFLDGAMVSSYIKLPTFLDLVRDRKAWMYNVISSDSRLLLISLNGIDEYLVMSKGLHRRYVPSEENVTKMVLKGVGERAPVSVIRSLPWTGGIALVAERFRAGRLFLCGDSCHLFSPTGGFGMNTGIDDARNLSWKLAACVQDWGSDGLLSSYEEERKPIAHRNTEAALFLTKRLGQVAIPKGLEEDSTSADEKRSALSERLSVLRSQFASLGVELGARYDHSPLIWQDGPAPPDVWEDYCPSSVPGGRLPHLWLDEGFRESDALAHATDARTSLFDALGVGFTLLRIGPDAPSGSGFMLASQKLRMPFNILDLPRHPAIELYEKKLVLVRPDHHIAWRGDRIDLAPEAILRRCLGWQVH